MEESFESTQKNRKKIVPWQRRKNMVKIKKTKAMTTLNDNDGYDGDSDNKKKGAFFKVI